MGMEKLKTTKSNFLYVFLLKLDLLCASKIDDFVLALAAHVLKWMILCTVRLKKNYLEVKF